MWCTINNQRCLCLLDIRSEANLLSARLTERCRITPTSQKLSVAKGSAIFVIGEVSLQFRYEGHAYPLPKITDILDALSGATWFSTLIHRCDYRQIGMHPADADKTEFVTRRGPFRWSLMPMSLTGTILTFERIRGLQPSTQCTYD